MTATNVECRSCGRQIEGESVFCRYCGQQVPLRAVDLQAFLDRTAGSGVRLEN
jgi:rRNA maturation endonuclease Nob1